MRPVREEKSISDIEENYFGIRHASLVSHAAETIDISQELSSCAKSSFAKRKMMQSKDP